MIILGDPEVTANTYCISRNLPNTDTQNYGTDLRYTWVTQYVQTQFMFQSIVVASIDFRQLVAIKMEYGIVPNPDMAIEKNPGSDKNT